jgi:hypothetical protein
MLENPDVNPQFAQGLALVEGAANAAIDRVQLRSLSGKLPMFGRYLDRIASDGVRRTVKIGANVVEQNLQEGAQDLIAPVLETAVASLREDMPDKDFSSLMDEWAGQRAETFFATLPLALIGGGIATYQDIKNPSAELNATRLRQVGFDKEQTTFIQRAENPEEYDARIQMEWDKRTPENIEAGRQEILNTIAQASTPGENDARISEKVAEDGTRRWVVTAPDGRELLQTQDQQAALEAVRQHSEAQMINERNTVADMVDYFRAQDPTNTATIEAPRTVQQELDRLTEAGDSKGIANLNERIRFAGIPEGADLTTYNILGEANVETTAEGVFRGVIKLRENSRPEDAFEEINHVFVRKAIAEGRVDLDSLRGWLTQTSEATGETYATETETEIIENIAKVGMDYAAGRIDETSLPASFVDYIKRMLQVFKEAMARAIKLKDAFATGKIDSNFESFLADSVGLNQQARVDTARERVGGELTQGNFNYSIGSMAERIAATAVIDKDGKILSSPLKTHAQLMEESAFDLDGGEFPPTQNFGFVTTAGRFVLQKEAQQLAQQAKQVQGNQPISGEIVSGLEREGRLNPEVDPLDGSVSEINKILREVGDQMDQGLTLQNYATRDDLPEFQSSAVDDAADFADYLANDLAPQFPKEFANRIKSAAGNIQSQAVSTDTGATNYSIGSDMVVENGRAYSPMVRDLLQRRAAGEDIPRSVIDQAISDNFPAQLVEPPKSESDLPTRATIDDAINEGQRRDQIDKSSIQPGDAVTIRQDVPAMTRKGVGVVTIKSKSGNSYDAAARISDPQFILNEKKSLEIGMGGAKGPHIAIRGKWASDQSMPSDLSEWTQVGFNPDRHSFYYDRATMKQVVGGSEAYQIGNTVFVKDAKFGDGQISDISYSIGKKQDADYLAAVERGDMETAQRMVDEAAKASGYSGSDHRMQHSAPDRESTALASIKTSDLLPNDYWEKPQFYQSMPEEWESFSAVKDALDRSEKYTSEGKDGGKIAKITVYRSVPKSIKEESIRNGDWVTPSKEYAALEGRSIPEGYKIISQKVSLKNLWWDGNSIAELGFDDGKDYAYKNTKNNRKLIDPVTYDENKNVIPLSQRFNPRSPNINYSIASQSEIDRVNRALGGMNRGPDERLKVYERARQKFSRVMQENKEQLDAIRSAVSTNTAPAIEQIEMDRAGRIADIEAEENTEVAKALQDNADTFLPRIEAAPTPAERKRVERDAKDRAKILEQGIRDKYAERKKSTDAEAKSQRDQTLQAAAAKDSAANARMREKVRQTKLVDAIGELDGILEALPPEVRGRVGGFAVLANIGTGDKALADFFVKRIDMIDRQLERTLKEEYGNVFDALLERTKPKKAAAGEKPKGIGADIQSLFATVREARDWSAEKVDGHIANIETQIASGNLTAQEEAMLTREADLVSLVGDWKNADSSRRAAALSAATETWAKGMSTFVQKKIREREERDMARAEAISATGKKGDYVDRRKRDEKDNGVKGQARGWYIDTISWDQVVGVQFGHESPMAIRLSDGQRKAEYAKIDGIQAKEDAVHDLFTKLAGGKRVDGERLMWNMSQPSIPANGLNLSQLEALSATMLWAQEDGRRHMIGELDENGNPTSDWHYNQQFIDDIESQLSPEAKTIRDFLLNAYGKEWFAINSVYRELNGVNLPRIPNYSPVTVTPINIPSGMVTDPVTGNAVSATSISPGALRNRGVAIAEPNFRNVIHTYIAHTRQMEHWKAFSPWIKEANGILRFRKVHNAMHEASGGESSRVIGLFLDAFAQGGNRDASLGLEISKTMGGMASRAAQVALVGRVGTLAIQATQIGAASAELPVGAYLSRLGKLVTGNLGWGDAINSKYIQRRIKQMPVTVQIAMEGLRAGKPNELKHQVEKIGRLIGGSDALWTAGTYAMVYDYQLGQAKALGYTGKAAEDYAENIADRITDRLAQPTRMGTRSIYEITTTNPAARLAWAFASESRKNLALLAYTKANRPLKRFLAATAGYVFFNLAMGALIRNAWKDMKDDGDDEDDFFDEKTWNWKRMGVAMLTEPLQGMPLLGDYTEKGINAALGQYHQSSDLINFERGIKSFKNIPDILQGERDAEGVLKDIDGMVSLMGLFNQNAAAAASLTHIASDFFGVVDNATTED